MIPIPCQWSEMNWIVFITRSNEKKYISGLSIEFIFLWKIPIFWKISLLNIQEAS